MLAKTGNEKDRETESHAVYDKALALARAIESLLEEAASTASGAEGYGLRLSEAMTRSLIDQLDELKRSNAA